jgi:hypothetical protein
MARRLIFDPEYGGDVSPKRLFTYGLQSFIFEKVAFIITAVRTSNPTAEDILRDYRVSGPCSSFDILNDSKEHNVSETGAASIFR